MATKGVIGVYSDEKTVLAAALAAREKNKYKKYDVFTPYPIHGMDDAMGLKRSWLTWVCFGAGLTGLTAGLTLQIWTSAVSWPINIGGKPMVSLPAFIPIFTRMEMTNIVLMFRRSFFGSKRYGETLKRCLSFPSL